MKKENPLIAVTVSPRRRALLARVFPGISFAAPGYTEKKVTRSFAPGLLSLYHAFRKAASLKAARCTVLGFDTVVHRGRKVYPQPGSREEAERTIRDLCHRVHEVVTGFVLIGRGRVRFGLSRTRVLFRQMSEEEIKAYLDSGLWQGKAGGYGIQDTGFSLVREYKGDYFNIVGLPLHRIKALLKKD